jgi:glycyl-tRNA synthetase beta chain
MPEFILEIGTEEIPAGYVEPAVKFLEKQLTEFFAKNHVRAEGARTWSTPRRLAVGFADVAGRQEDVVETFLGPGVQSAFDAEGKPTKAAIGFARGKGLDVSQLTRETTPRGEVICARVEKPGQPTADILAEYLPQLIAVVPFPKKMRWGSRALAFARPMHWIVALFSGSALPFQVDGLASGNRSRGHRFLAPAEFAVTGLDDYVRQCETHRVMVDPVRRRQEIQKQIRALAEEVSGVVTEDPRLLDEVNQLVEYPVALRCEFEPRFLDLPRELLVMTMKRHQRYFPIEDKGGKLLPHFITISNIQPGPGREIQRGNQRVLRARLEDARFFYDEDRKRKLDVYAERLKGVVYQKALGTSYEKMERFRALARFLAEQVCPEVTANAERTAYLCKADLETQMVFEFPELQGTMGSYYAAHCGENAEVVTAIREHYRPTFAGDALPTNTVGAVVAIGDKLDTILGCIGVGLIPTGSEDPYGLRRHALGIIQILLAQNWQTPLPVLVDKGLDLLSAKLKLQRAEVRAHAFDLFAQRLKSLFDGEGFPYDAVDAVLSTGIDSFVDVRKKVEALSDLKRQPHFEPLAVAFRRVVSILDNAQRGEVRADLLREPEERALHETCGAIRGPVEERLAKKDYAGALEKIVEIKPAVDRFFDKVMVMAEDPALRDNRLNLLHQVSRLFSRIADFSKIVLKKS